MNPRKIWRQGVAGVKRSSRLAFWVLTKGSRRLGWGVGRMTARATIWLHGVQVGENFRVNSAPLIIVHPDQASITIGKDVTILNSTAENPAGLPNRTTLGAVQPNSRIVIGNRVGISGATICAWKSIIIEDDAMIGAGATIYDTDFHNTHPIHRHARPTPETVPCASVVIRKGAWLGARSTILKGVEVGRHAVIACGAVVTTNVPPGAIVGGVPAKLIGWVTGFEPPPTGTGE